MGHDRPGVVAAVTGALAELGGNLEDSTMTILGGHFAMMLIVSGDADAATVQDRLTPIGDRLGVVCTAAAVPVDVAAPAAGVRHLLTVHGADRPGIVSAMTGLVASHGGNITDLSTRLAGDLYLVIAEVDLPAGEDAAALSAEVDALARSLGVGATLRVAEADLL